MDDGIKISQALEEEESREENFEVEKALSENVNEDDNSDNKIIIVSLVIIIGLFALTFGGFQLYDNLTSAEVVNLDGLHQENLNGDLEEEVGYMYNGFSFVKADGLWWTEIEYQDRLLKIPLHFGPKEVENIEITGKLTEGFNYGNVNIAVDPTINYNKYYTLALMELNNNVVQGIKRDIITACTENSTVCEDRPIINCEENNGEAVIQIVVSDEPGKIELSGTCIKLIGNDLDLTKSVDRLVYQWHGIMQ